MTGDLFDHYKRCVDFIKGDLSRFGYLGVMNLLVMYIFFFMYQFVAIFISFFIFIPIIILSIGFVLLMEGVLGIVIGIFLIILGGILLLAIIALFIATIVIMWAVIGGLNIFISEKLHSMGDGKKIILTKLLREAYDRKKELAEKGVKLMLAYLLVSMPVTLFIILLSFGMMMVMFLALPAMAMDPFVATPVILIMILVFSLIAVLIYPVFFVLMFFQDMTAIQMADGKDVKEAAWTSLRTIRRSKKGVLLYCLGLFFIILAMNFLFPLAILAQGFLTIVSKSFIMANPELFNEE
ncbi:MAG: hypothetical protein R6V01_04450 [Thermoplasmatota archaeon]